jgi:hypothetical protein
MVASRRLGSRKEEAKSGVLGADQIAQQKVGEWGWGLTRVTITG